MWARPPGRPRCGMRVMFWGGCWAPEADLGQLGASVPWWPDNVSTTGNAVQQHVRWLLGRESALAFLAVSSCFMRDNVSSPRRRQGPDQFPEVLGAVVSRKAHQELAQAGRWGFPTTYHLCRHVR